MLSLKLLLGTILLVLAGTLVGVIVPIMLHAGERAVDNAVDNILEWTHNSIKAGLHSYFQTMYPTVKIVDRMFERGELDVYNYTKRHTILATLWDLTVANPHALYVYIQTFPQGGFYGTTQVLGDKPYYDVYFSEEGNGTIRGHMWAVPDPKTGIPDFTVDYGPPEYNATLEVTPPLSTMTWYPGIPELVYPHPDTETFTNPYIFLSPVFGPVYNAGYYASLYLNGHFVGETGVEVSL
eukprot:Sspe_Gene.119620::Locus_116024_Transcript_1_2_Confidence_0.750_Length_772::g.119620::m.119620